MKSELESEFSQYSMFSTEWKRISLGQTATHEAAEQLGSSHRGSILGLFTRGQTKDALGMLAGIGEDVRGW